MKKLLLAGLVLALVLAAALGAFFGIDAYQKNQAKKAAEKAASLILGNFEGDDVTGLELHTADFDYTIEPDGNGKWRAADADAPRINTYYITALCTYGSKLSAAEDLGILDEATRRSYGLDDPSSVTYRTADGDTTLYIGNMSPTGEYYYMMQAGKENVYLVDAEKAGFLCVTEDQLRYRYALSDTLSGFTAFSLERDGEMIYDYEQKDGIWALEQPISTPLNIDGSKITTLFNSISELECEGFADTADYDFEKPAYIFRCRQENGDATTLRFAPVDPEKTELILCRRDEDGQIMQFDSTYLGFLQGAIDSFLDSGIMRVSDAEIDSFSIRYDGIFNEKANYHAEAELSIDHEKGDYIYEGEMLTGSAYSSASRWAGMLFSAISNMTFENVDQTLTPPAHEPTCVIEYRFTDGTQRTISFVPKDENRYYAFIDGQFTYALVRQRQLSGENKMLECYDHFMMDMENIRYQS